MLHFNWIWVEITLSAQLIQKSSPDSFIIVTAWKVSKYGVISGSYFPVFFYEYHFNWMWVEVALSAQSIENSTPV